ncbi:ABC transporter substrate-binding protein [Halomonas cupida]|uniref:ABC transporter substrate-binding protein n=1 Tax=Halomonas cupida TaxID=44933 RepID=A0A1M6ZIB6_9GAMM|nr:transporter substrate-binding domain-containing protein [Halomonas cupida]GEN24352.1 ABC transporter substrate-binding protein [Halomonas cupida]SHL30180.1 polar amino acid transport system substrate-binding protein [Halomonas cupida]
MHEYLETLRRQLTTDNRLRAAINLGNPVLAQRKDNGELGGVSVTLAQHLAELLQVEIEFVVHDAAGKVVAARDSNQWDLAFLARDPLRAETIAFTSPYVIIEGTYLVAQDAPFQTVSELDAKGVDIAVGQGAAYDLYLSRTLQYASIVRAPTSADAVHWKVERQLDAAAGVRQPLEHYCADHPGYRVLPGSFTRIEQAMAVPSDHADAIAPLERFLQEARQSGLIHEALQHSGQNPAIAAGNPIA